MVLFTRVEGHQPGLQLLLRLVDVQFTQYTGTNIVNQAVNLEATLPDCIEDDSLLLDNVQPLPHVEFDQLQRRLLRRQGLEQREVTLTHLPQGQEPRVQDPKLLITHRGCDTATRSVTADDNVLDFEMLDGKLDDRARAEVTGVEDICDIAVHEDIARVQAQEGGFGASRVRAAQPQDLWLLAICKGWEEIGLFACGLCSPFLIQGQTGLVPVGGSGVCLRSRGSIGANTGILVIRAGKEGGS